MPVSKELLRVRSARQHKLRAKVGVLRGGRSDSPDYPGAVLMLDGMRSLLATRVGYSRVVLVRRPEGFALCVEPSHCERIWLVAEHSKRVRIFKRLETAVTVCELLGASVALVELEPRQLHARVVQ